MMELPVGAMKNWPMCWIFTANVQWLPGNGGSHHPLKSGPCAGVEDSYKLSRISILVIDFDHIMIYKLLIEIIEE